MAAGTYYLDIVDDCDRLWESVAEFEVETWQGVTANHAVTNSCSNENTGGIKAFNVDIPDPDQEIIYQWSNGETGHSLEDIAAGTYTLTITGDVTGCNRIYEYTVGVDEIEVLDVFILGETNQPFVGPLENGSIELSFDNPNDYTFEWSDGSTDNPLWGVSAGTYMVTITNGEGCSEVFSYEVLFCESLKPLINKEATIVTALDSDEGGSITLLVDNVNEPLSYFWEGPDSFESNEQNLLDITDAGEYCVTVVDPCFGSDSHCFLILDNCEDATNRAKILFNAVNNCMDEESGSSSLAFEGIDHLLTPPNPFSQLSLSDGLWSLEWSTGETAIVELDCNSDGDCEKGFGGVSKWSMPSKA
ncbi:MAG: hypothetical protein AAGJ93_17970, partial [Bacteroidota bacterium]